MRAIVATSEPFSFPSCVQPGTTSDPWRKWISRELAGHGGFMMPSPEADAGDHGAGLRGVPSSRQRLAFDDTSLEILANSVS